MELKKINSLVELFYKKYEEKTLDESKKKEEFFLSSLKNKDLTDTLSGPYTYSWENIHEKINIL